MVKKTWIPVANVWETRFHRKIGNERPTKDWIFYISRPTLESLRKSDNMGKNAFRYVKKVVGRFLSKNVTASKFVGDFRVKTSITETNSGSHYTTLAYPFDISEEIKGGKLGVYIHYDEIPKNYVDADQENISLEMEDYPSMFDESFQKSLHGKLISGNDTTISAPPPKIGQADPMWMEFSSGKILMTDVMINTEEEDWLNFRQLISSQFIEIRLIRHSKAGRNQANREQVDALQKFYSFDSGYSHFAGAPGTGKSTLLHMTCAHQLFIDHGPDYNWNDEIDLEYSEDYSKILYYVPSPFLVVEARREIERILQYVYYHQHAKPDMVIADGIRRMVSEQIEFVSQEDLFGNMPKPSYEYNLISGNKDLFCDKIGINQGDRDKDKTISIFKRQLRQIVFGLFGEPESFETWLNKNKKKLRSTWMNKKISLVNPETRTSSEHNISMGRFLNYDEEYSDFRRFFDRLRKENMIFEGDGKRQQFWDPAGMIYLAYQQNQKSNSIWQKYKSKFDQIIIDEIQDITLLEARILLEHFSNRDSNNAIKPFRFIGAGDENQNIKFLEYFPRNEHMKYLFKDYVTSVRVKTSRITGLSLSHGLTPSQEETLTSSYRIPNVMIAYVRDLLESLHVSATKGESNKGWSKAGIERTVFGRNGVLLTLDQKILKRTDAEGRAYLDAWTEKLLDDFKNQVDHDDKLNKAPKIAFIFDDIDWDHSRIGEQMHPLHDYLEEISVEVPFIKNINDHLQEFFRKLKQELNEKGIRGDEEISSELKTTLAAKGVMSVEAIKGLTVPISIVLPPRNMREINHSKDLRENMPYISKFLVQITRAQYLNLILGDKRVFKHEMNAVDTEIQKTDVSDWLTNILTNALGLTKPYFTYVEDTLNNYQSYTAWRVLQKETEKQVEVKNLPEYIEFLRTFYENLMKKNLPAFLEENSFDQKTWGGFSRVEEIYGLPNRVSKELLCSLRIFATVNEMYRDFADRGETTIDGGRFPKLLEEWLLTAENGSRSDDENNDTENWIRLLLGPMTEDIKWKKDSKNHSRKWHENNELYDSINLFFNPQTDNVQERTWPQEKLPELNMGGWRLINRTKLQIDPQGDEQVNQHITDAWMSPDSAYFTINDLALERAIISNRGEQIKAKNSHYRSFADKFLLYLSMNMDDANRFSTAMIRAIVESSSSINETHPVTDEIPLESTTRLFEWYVGIYHQFKSQKKVFFNAVQTELEQQIKQEENQFKDKLSSFLEASKTIDELNQRLEAFKFEDWAACTNLLSIFENSVKITAERIDQTAVNPFSKDTLLHKYLWSHKDKLSPLHKKMFLSLFTIQEGIRTGKFTIHIANNNIELPNHKWENEDLKTHYFTCLNHWTNVVDDGAKLVSTLELDLLDLIRPPQSKKQAAHEASILAWIQFFKSIHECDDYAFNLFNELRKQGGSLLIQRFLSYPFNYSLVDSTNMDKAQLRDYLKSPQGCLIQMLRLRQGFADVRSDRILEIWKTMPDPYIGNEKAGSTHNDHDVRIEPWRDGEPARIYNKRYQSIKDVLRSEWDGADRNYLSDVQLEFMVRSITQPEGFEEDRTYLKSESKRGKKTHHQGARLWPKEYSSNSTFAALAYLADDEIENCIQQFQEAGLFNHAFVLMTHLSFEHTADLKLKLIQRLIKAQIYKSDELLYLPHSNQMGLLAKRMDQNLQYRYGIGPDFGSSDLKLKHHIHEISDIGGYASTPSPFKLWKSNVDDTRIKLFLEYRGLTFNTRILEKFLKEMRDSTKNANEYVNKLKDFKNNEFKETYLLCNRTEKEITQIEFKWDKRLGFLPNKKHLQYSHKYDFIDFLIKLFSTEDQPTLQQISYSLEQLTEVNGATLVHINPERKRIDITSDAYREITALRTNYDSMKANVIQVVKELFAVEHLPREQASMLSNLIVADLENEWVSFAEGKGSSPAELALAKIDTMGEALLGRIKEVNDLRNILLPLKEMEEKIRKSEMDH